MVAEFADRGTLERGNQGFHEAYKQSLGTQQRGPVLVLLNNELIVLRNGWRHSFPLESQAFSVAKVAVHLAVATFLLSERTERLRATLEHAERLLRDCRHAPATAIEREIVPLLEACCRFGRRWLEPGDSVRRADERDEFGACVRERVLRLTDLATEAELQALHAATQTALEWLDESQQSELEVVVAGNHQARARSLGMQYFARRLGEPEGEERRVAYGENIQNEQQALELVATRRLDRELARAFFGDETRMQRDLLADAATRCLDRMELEPALGVAKKP